MRRTSAILLACSAIIITACAAHPEPIIDMKGVDRGQYTEDWNECERYSHEVQVSKGTAKGAAAGAVIGAVAGAIGGNSGDVADGAGTGAVYGGASSGLAADREKQMVFKRCMRGRGYRVLN